MYRARPTSFPRKDDENETDARISVKFTETDARKVRNLFKDVDLAMGDILLVNVKLDKHQTKLEEIKPKEETDPNPMIPAKKKKLGRPRNK